MRLFQVSVCWFFIFCLVAVPARGDEQGKLAGTILNQDTGEPLANVEITLLNTPKKTLTDETGKFFIINIDPGFYDVQAFYLGFVPVIVKNVCLSSDHTTRLNLKLSATIIELGKTITHDRGRPLIEENETYSLSQFNAQDLRLRPLENFAQIQEYVPGVNWDPVGRVHLRGGRSNEVALLVDGIPYNEPFANQPAFDFSLDEIDALTLKTGVFNAEHGQANSGVIQIKRKQLTEDYRGMLGFQTGDVFSLNSDIFSDEIKSFNGINNWKLQGRFSGPIPKYLNKKLRFSLATQYWDDQGYLYGQDAFTPAGEKKSEEPGKISLNSKKQFLLNYQMAYVFNPRLSLAYHTNFQYQKWQDYNNLAAHQWSFLPDGTLWNYTQGNSHYLKLAQEFSPKIYYTLSTGYLWNKNRIEAFEQDDDAQYQWSGWLLKDLQNEFYVSGTNNYRSSENTNTLSTKFDLTAQIGHRNMLRSGFEFRRHDLTFHQYFVEADREERDDNGDGIPGNVGINPDSLNDEYRFQPVEIAFYLQDKIEWDAIALNLGMRFDYFDSKGVSQSGWWQSESDSLRSADKQLNVSPRVSMAYNISEKGKLFASYGHFYQTPPYWGIFSNLNYENYATKYLPQMGNIDLPLQKTVAYEIGLEHLLPANASFGLKWFYRDFRNLLGRRIYVTPNAQSLFAVWDAADFGFTQGAIVEFSKKFSSTFSLDLAYTYQRVKMNNSEPFLGEKISENKLKARSLATVHVADWDQPHMLQLHFYWTRPESWGLTFHSQIASGYPYTAKRIDPLKNTVEYNGSRGPVQINTTLQAFKTFPIWIGYKKSSLTMELKIYNLLDRLNELTVWPSSGESDQPIGPLRVGISPEWMKRPYWYSKPREILFGLRYRF